MQLDYQQTMTPDFGAHQSIGVSARLIAANSILELSSQELLLIQQSRRGVQFISGFLQSRSGAFKCSLIRLGIDPHRIQTAMTQHVLRAGRGGHPSSLWDGALHSWRHRGNQ
jgi:hypothetical protein